MLADYHVHTEFSDDSDYDMEEVVLDAIAMGLDEICFTDHVDYNVKLDHGAPGDCPRHKADGSPERNTDYPAYFSKIAKMQEKYSDQITIRKGLEFGLQMCALKEYQDLFNRYPMDFVIHSNHQVDNIEIHLPEFREGKTQKEYNRIYYEEILRTVNAYKDYSVVGHLDAFNRYDPQGVCPLSDFVDLVYEILKVVIADKKGIELNTSSVRFPIGDLTPCREILKIYRSLGGEIITIGSDSHRKGQLGTDIARSQAILKDLGYEYFCTFEKMQPIFHKL